MSKLAAFLSANSGPLIGAGVFVVGTVGTGVYLGVLSPKDIAAPVAQEIALPATDVPKAEDAVLTPDVEPEAAVEPDVAAILPIAPSIDEVRSEADGLTILAGRGEPGASLRLMVDADENTTVQVGNDGAFAIVAFLDPSPEARVLSVIQNTGEVELAAADIILAPQAVVQAEVASKAATPLTQAEQVAKAATDPERSTPEDVAKAEDALAAPDDGAEPVAVVTAPKPTPEPTAEVAILKSDEDGVEIINRSSAPEVMSNVEIDTISYSEEGDVLLSGRAQSAATVVRVYLDNAAVTTLNVDTSGRWRGDLPDVDTGVYTLRVDEVDAEGAVTSRVETPFKRESPEVLTANTGNGDAPAKAITVQTGTTLWAIARERYGDGTLYVRVFEANADSIKNADLIYPGQVFDLPD
jgi:nucleoid-associated protein YgaU